MEREMTALEIADVNDYIRHNLFEGGIERNGVIGRVVTTPSIMALGSDKYSQLFSSIVNFRDFTPENDPYGEHDFGFVEMFACKFCWKFSYYDESMKSFGYHTHVLTIMKFSEH